jgi:hypothetical protein
MNFRWIRWIIVIAIVCAAVLVAGYRLTQSEPETVVAAPISAAVKNVSLEMQATTLEQVVAREGQTVVQPTLLFEDAQLGYHVSYPVDWEMIALSSTAVLFQSNDGVTQVKVEAAGPVPADGLIPFVDRSLYSDVVLSRQSLTIHGFPAERVVVFSDSPGGQKITFFIETDASAYVITGLGQQSLIEKIARSFNAPQVVARR